jgi:integrase/recombinase XerD
VNKTVLQFNAGLVVQPKARPNALHERILGDADVRLFLNGIENKRDKLLFSTIYLLGLRISECLAIKKKDIYQVRDGSYKLYILGKGSKERVLTLPESLALELLAAGNDELVFPSRSGKLLTRSYIHKLIKTYSAISGLSEFLSCHWLRHTHATTAIENGCDLHVLQASLGHSSLAITSKYLHVRGEQSSCSFVSI